jgi:hypothetical protein
MYAIFTVDMVESCQGSWTMHSLIRSQQMNVGCVHEWRSFTNESYVMIQVWNPLPGVNAMWVAVDTM